VLTGLSNHPRYLRLDTFKIIRRNSWFTAVILSLSSAQVLVMFVGGTTFNLTRLNGTQWGISIVVAIFTCFGIATLMSFFRWLLTILQAFSLPSRHSFSISETIGNNRRSGIRETMATALASILTASIAGSIAGLPTTTHRFQRKISLKRMYSWGLFTWVPMPLILEQMRLTFYTIYINGFRIEALADTGASVNLVSKSYLRQNPAAWDAIPHKCNLALGNGRTCRSSGYIRTSIRFDNSEDLHPTTLHIINGLPYDVALSHDFLSTTSTVQFSRPGGITRDGSYPSQSANAVILTHLVAVRQNSILDKVKNCCGWERRLPSAAPEDSSSSSRPHSLFPPGEFAKCLTYSCSRCA
jgi:hypothetical protein